MKRSIHYSEAEKIDILNAHCIPDWISPKLANLLEDMPFRELDNLLKALAVIRAGKQTEIK